MQRILDPAQIEAFAERSIPRVRLADPTSVFARRAARLRALAEDHALGDYLRLMAALAHAQQAHYETLAAALKSEGFASHLDRQIEVSKTHRMPPLQAAGWPRQERWLAVLRALCETVGRTPGFPAAVRAACDRIVAS